MNKVRDIFIGILIGCMIMATPVLADSILTQIDVVLNGVNVQVNGEDVEVDSILYNNSTYLPMRKVAELVGKDIKWNDETKTANIVEKSSVQEGDIMDDNSIMKENKIIETENGANINEVEFYKTTYIQEKIIGNSNYMIQVSYDNGSATLQLVEQSENPEIIIESIPFESHGGYNYISKDYYENTILPLIK